MAGMCKCMAGILDVSKAFFLETVLGIESPTTELKGLTIEDVNLKSIELECSVEVFNPGRTDLPICEIEFTIKSADRLIASGIIKDPGNIKGNEKTEIKIPLTVQYNFMIKLARNIGSDWDIDYTIDAVLVIDIPIFPDLRIPVYYSDTLELPTVKDIF